MARADLGGRMQGHAQKFEKGGRNFRRPIYRPKSTADQKNKKVQFTARNQVKTKKKDQKVFISFDVLYFSRGGGCDPSAPLDMFLG